MIPLFVLAGLLLALWLFGIWERDRRAWFMREWVHALFIAAVIVFVMAIGVAIRSASA